MQLHLDREPSVPSIFGNVSETMKYPRIVRLRPNLHAVVFELLKIVPAKYVIENAIASGRIQPSTVVAETSSGTYALGMAIVCAENNLRFAVYSDPAIDADLQRRLEDLGGVVHIVKADPTENPQTKRLEELHAFLECNDAFWPQQYDSGENRKAYHEVAHYVAASLGKPFELVGTVGSGGSTCGLIEGLRQRDPSTRLIGVDTFSSVLFGLPNGKRILRGLGNSIHPKNLIHAYYDDVHWLDHHVAYAHTRRLHQENSIFAGPTSGAAYAVADFMARTNPERNFAFVAADSGHRYMRSVYAEPIPRASMTVDDAAPVLVDGPCDVSGPWNCMTWGRRTLEAVTASQVIS